MASGLAEDSPRGWDKNRGNQRDDASSAAAEVAEAEAGASEWHALTTIEQSQNRGCTIARW